MAKRHFEIDSTPDSVNVSTSESAHTNARHPSVNVAIMVISIGFFLWQCFRHDRYGYSLWRYLVRYPSHSHTFIESSIVLAMLAAMTALFFSSALRAFFPSGEVVHCDRSTLTIRKIPFLTFRGKWKVCTFPVSELSGLRYAVLQSGRGEGIYGIRFVAAGSKQKMLAGLTAPQAYKILGALRKLGADVPNHRDMRYEVREALRDQREQL